MKSPDAAEYCRILGVSLESSTEQIRDKFRALSKIYHPDGTHPKRNAEIYKKISEAFAYLKNPNNRKTVDFYKPRQEYTIPIVNILVTWEEQKKEQFIKFTTKHYGPNVPFLINLRATDYENRVYTITDIGGKYILKVGLIFEPKPSSFNTLFNFFSVGIKENILASFISFMWLFTTIFIIFGILPVISFLLSLYIYCGVLGFLVHYEKVFKTYQDIAAFNKKLSIKISFFVTTLLGFFVSLLTGPFLVMAHYSAGTFSKEKY